MIISTIIVNTLHLIFAEYSADLLPSRNTVSEEALTEVYTCMKSHLIEYLQNTPKHACITFDSWTDRYRHTSYMIYTYHCIDNWELKSFVLKTTSFPYAHTGMNIKNGFLEMINEFKLHAKILTLVTDNGTNMCLAAELLNLPRAPCLAHKIQRLIMKDMYEHERMLPLRRIIRKLRSIQKVLLYSHNKLVLIADDDFQTKYIQWLTDSSELGKPVY